MNRNLEVLKFRKLCKTYQELGNLFGFTHQRARQICIQFKDNPRLVITQKLINRKCEWCKKKFKRYENQRQGKHIFCSSKCFWNSIDTHRTAKEWRDLRNARGNKYYHEVLKKRSDFHELIHERNQRQLAKKTK